MVTSNAREKKYKLNGVGENLFQNSMIFTFLNITKVCNGVRGFIDSIQASKDNQDVAEVIWVRFNDDNVGQLLRQDNKDLQRDHTPNHHLAVPIKKQRKTFSGQGSVNWVREQFPLTLCYAITAHKV